MKLQLIACHLSIRHPLVSKSLKRSIFSSIHKRYYISFNDIEKVVGSDDKIEYFEKEFGVKIYPTNENGSKMILTICAIQLDVNIDDVVRAILYFCTRYKTNWLLLKNEDNLYHIQVEL